MFFELRCRDQNDEPIMQHALQTQKRMVPFLFVRGDGVILLSPPLRS